MGTTASLPKNTDANLAAISKATENITYTTPEEANKKRLAELQSKYLTAKQTVLTAPAAERDAEKAYYTAAEGSDGYAKRAASRAATEAAALKLRLVQAHGKDLAHLGDALGSYATTARYAANLEGVVLKQLTEVIEMSDALQAGESAQLTNHRKTAFLSAERSTVASWDSHLTVGLWVLALVYAKARVLPQLGNPVGWAVLGLITASPWLLGGVGWVVDRRIPPFNAYTTFSS
jgi:hypothetical protein